MLTLQLELQSCDTYAGDEKIYPGHTSPRASGAGNYGKHSNHLAMAGGAGLVLGPTVLGPLARRRQTTAASAGSTGLPSEYMLQQLENYEHLLAQRERHDSQAHLHTHDALNFLPTATAAAAAAVAATFHLNDQDQAPRYEDEIKSIHD